MASTDEDAAAATAPLTDEQVLGALSDGPITRRALCDRLTETTGRQVGLDELNPRISELRRAKRIACVSPNDTWALKSA